MNTSVLKKLGILTPDKSGQIVPPGHVLTAEKLRHSELAKALAALVSVTFSPELERCGVDFCPTVGSAVIYLSEEEVKCWSEHKERILKLRKAYPVRGIVVADRIPSIQLYYSQLQHLVVGELGMELIPVLGYTEVPLILNSLMQTDSRQQSNPFRPRSTQKPSNDQLLQTISQIPTVGEKRAHLLLEKFGSLANIAAASSKDLSQIVGMQSADNIVAFFSDPIMGMPKK